MTQIASYFARVGLSTDLAQLKKVDRYLALIESKMRAFQKRAQKNNGAFNINFKFNTGRLEFDVQRAFLNVSRRVRFPIENFTINRNSLATQVSSAIRQAINSSNRNINLNARVSPQARRTMGSGGASGLIPAGVGGGLAGRLGVGGVSGLGAMYGLNRLNQANQEAISARLTTQAVIQGRGGTEKEGQQAFAWLRGLGNEVGFDYMAAAPDYNQFLSNAMGAGLDTGGAQDIFQGFSEYQTAMGVVPARRKLVQNALSQMLGKGVLSMEEVRRQMAESMPGTMDVFAEAFAEMSGNGLTGQKSIAAFYEAVEGGDLESAKILPIVAKLLSKRAEPKLGVMKKTSIAEAGRLRNAMSDLVERFSTSGGEKGFAAIFRGFGSQARESTSLVEGIGRAFEYTGSKAERLLVFAESFNRAIEGKDSQVADWLGAEKTAQLQEDWAQLKATFSDLSGMLSVDWPWVRSLEDITLRLQETIGWISKIGQFGSETSSVMSQIKQDAMDRYGKNPYGGELIGSIVGNVQAGLFAAKSGLNLGGKAVGSAYTTVMGELPLTSYHPALQFANRKVSEFNSNSNDPVANYWMQRQGSGSFDTPEAWRDMTSGRAKEFALESVATGKYNGGFKPGTSISGNTFNMDFQVQDAAGMEQWLKGSFQQEVENALQFFNYNE